MAVPALAVATAMTAEAGTITGTVTDPAGKPVASADVSISGTSYSTSTAADGRFTLPDVQKGTYIVTVRYPGFHDSSEAVTLADDKTVEVNFNAYAAELSDVLVVANRYQAAAAQMSSVNTTNVMSAEDLEHTAVHNVAEALELMPGVNVMNTGMSFFGGIDGASRGEGMFASIRGLNAEYNVNLINGVAVAQGTPYSREVQLSLLPPSGLQTIVVNETSTADMDGDAIGGTVDFRTPTAYDFNEPLHGSLTVGGREESRTRDYGDSGLGGSVAGELAAKFGADNQFGVYASAYWDIRHYANSEMGAVMEVAGDGAWAYAVANADGSNPSSLDPSKNLQTTGFNVGVSSGLTRRVGGNVSLDWRPNDDTSVYARGSYALADTRQDSSLSQVLGRGVTYTPVGSTGFYQPLIKYVSTRFWYETNPEHAVLGSFQLGAERKLGHWTLAPKVFAGNGEDDRPNHIEISTRPLINGGNGFLYGSTTLATYDANGFPYPLLTPAMFAQLGNVATLPARRSGELTVQYSDQRKTGGQLDAKYDIGDGLWNFLKIGAKFVRGTRDATNQDWTNAKFTDGRTFGSLGIIDGWYSSVYPGVYNWSVPKINQAALFNLYNTHVNADSFDTCGGLAVNNWNCNSQHGTESVSSAYAMLNLRAGDFEIIPGLRFEHTQIDNSFWVMQSDANGNELPGHWGSNTTTYNEPLPSLFVNYRQSQASVYRAAVWTSYTRPPFVQLGGSSQVGVSQDGTTTIKQGNPNLKAIEAFNLDLSGEWTSEHGGHARLAGYAKELSHYIYDNGSTQVDPITSGSGLVRFTQPTNGGSGHVYGVELSLRQKFQDMPAPLDGFGIGGNLTRQKTAVHLDAQGLSPTKRIQNAPEFMANAEIFYEKYGFSVDAIYHYSGAYIAQYDFMNLGASWDDLWVRPVQRTDLHVGYAYAQWLRVDLSVANVFKDVTYWSHVGEHSLALSDIVDSGRTTLLTLKYTF
jgi:TonB-dependent receptor